MPQAPVILLVDDSEAMRAYLSALLQARFAECEVQAFRGLAEGLEGAVTASDRLKAIVTDFMLGEGATGIDLIEALSPPAAVAKILITQGGKLTAAEETRARSLGASILPKPTPDTQEKWLMAVSLSIR